MEFVVAEELKVGKTFNFGLFFSKGVTDPRVHRYPKRQRAAVLMESPIDRSYEIVAELERCFDLIFTHQEVLYSRGAPYIPMYFGTNWISVQDERSTKQISRSHPSKHKLVSFIGSLEHPSIGAYKLRREAADCLSQIGIVDCFGKGLNEVPGKAEAISPYMFSVAMENAASDYYFSEKLIDCCLLETVPIYYGCPSIGDLLDPRGLLTFKTIGELQKVVTGLSKDLYLQMRPYVLRNKKKIVENNWHSHLGLFTRIAAELVPRHLDGKSIGYKEASFGSKLKYRVSKAFSRFV